MIPDRLKVDLQSINQKVGENVYKLVGRAESAYKEQIADAIKEILNRGCRIVLVTGPSGAGKTTTSFKVKQQLEESGANVYVLNMDDFFRDSV